MYVHLHGCGGAVTWSTPLPDLAAAITCFLPDGNTLATTMDPPTAVAVTPPITPPTHALLGLTFAGRETGTAPVKLAFPVFLAVFVMSSTGAAMTPPCSTTTSLPSVFTIILCKQNTVRRKLYIVEGAVILITSLSH